VQSFPDQQRPTSKLAVHICLEDIGDIYFEIDAYLRILQCFQCGPSTDAHCSEQLYLRNGYCIDVHIIQVYRMKG